MQSGWMIYGANGYTGKLIAQEAKRRGLSPILAGRNPEAIKTLGQELGFDTKAFDLNNIDEACKNLNGLKAVLHCAGPFSATHKPMYQACIRTKTNYLDITGEIPIFEKVQHKRPEIIEAGIAVIPGVGFDVVPSDCLAALLKEAMPDATHLNLAFKFSGKPSPGSMKTIIESLPAGGVIRKDGKLTLVKSAYKTKKIKFDGKVEDAVTIPWGDVSTAFHSTGIPNIEFYMAATKGRITLMRSLRPIRLLFALPPIQAGLKSLAVKYLLGESETERAGNKTFLWGEVINAKGQRIEKRIETPNGYSLTIDAAIKCTELVLQDAVKPGPWTPSKAFGANFVLSLQGVRLL
jgi:short subunit dehydrogenase-like uncharacterized protein